MKRTLLLFLSILLFSCKNPCRQVIIQPPCSSCDTMTYIRTFPNCNDSLTYIDSTFEPGYLWHTGEMKNNVRNGKWTWFDKDGKIALIVEYQNGLTLSDQNYKEGKFVGSISYKYVDDRLKYIKEYDAINRTTQEGLTLNDLKAGKWIFIDSITGNKTISNYIPTSKCDTTTFEDANNPGTMISSVSCMQGVLHGALIKTDRQGKIILKENYINGHKE